MDILTHLISVKDYVDRASREETQCLKILKGDVPTILKEMFILWRCCSSSLH